jgi:spheroidene monooxygenase
MNAYARSGAHLQAIQAAAQHGYFAESMFARFVPLQVKGQWQGKSYA